MIHLSATATATASGNNKMANSIKTEIFSVSLSLPSFNPLPLCPCSHLRPIRYLTASYTFFPSPFSFIHLFFGSLILSLSISHNHRSISPSLSLCLSGVSSEKLQSLYSFPMTSPPPPDTYINIRSRRLNILSAAIRTLSSGNECPPKSPNGTPPSKKVVPVPCRVEKRRQKKKTRGICLRLEGRSLFWGEREGERWRWRAR